MKSILSRSYSKGLVAFEKPLSLSNCQLGATRFTSSKPILLDHWIPSLKDKNIPVVLLKDRPGLGVKGQIVYVLRGHARHNLVPAGHAVNATWENIDNYMDPNLYAQGQVFSLRADDSDLHTLDWIKKIRMKYVLPTCEGEENELIEPIPLPKLLEDLSVHHELDMLPREVFLQDHTQSIRTVGEHMLQVSVPLRVGAKDFSIVVEVVSDAQLRQAIQRKKELEVELARKKDFKIVEQEYEIEEVDEAAETAQKLLHQQEEKLPDEEHEIEELVPQKLQDPVKSFESDALNLRISEPDQPLLDETADIELEDLPADTI
eukprot:Platyproteum_vivax@DN1106_c0_g1_i1.p2